MSNAKAHRPTMEFETYIKRWILEDLSKPVALLNNLPKCPYAKKALLDNKIKFYHVCKDLNFIIQEIAKDWNDDTLEVAVIHLDWEISPNQLENIVVTYNVEYKDQDFLFLDDHVEVDETIKNINFNNGKYNLLLMQRRSKIEAARKQLQKLNYYKNWPEDYYKEVTSI